MTKMRSKMTQTGLLLALGIYAGYGMDAPSNSDKDKTAPSQETTTPEERDEIDAFFEDLKVQNPEIEFLRNYEKHTKRRYRDEGKLMMIRPQICMGSINNLPDSICNLMKLTDLQICNQSFLSLPEEFGKLTNLKELCLYDNKLTQLPESIGNLTALTSLHLQNNLLEDLPLSFGNLTNLTYLNLGRNPLRPERTRVYPNDQREFTNEEITFLGGIRLSFYDGFCQQDIDTLLRNCREREIFNQ